MNRLRKFRMIRMLLILSIFLLTACGSSDGGSTGIPAAPDSGLQATAGDQRITLSWDAVPGADSYIVYWSNSANTGTGGTSITGLTSPFYHDGVTNGMDYYYVVTAVNVVGESGPSVEVNAIPVDILISSLSFADANLRSCVQAAIATYVHELTSLGCTDFSITDLGDIKVLSSLTDLNLNSNSIDDVSALSGLIALTSLNLGSNSTISDVTPLSRLTRLISLNLGTNSISDVSALSGMTSLTNLDLGYNGISDVSALSGMISLATLTLRYNSIAGQGLGHVDALTTLTSATAIYLNGNIGISCSELDTLITALGSSPVDTDGNTGTADIATDGVNCTNP